MARRPATGGRPTQAHVAALAGVSQTTVSLVLNDSATTRGRVGADVRQRVLGAIEATGYVANPSAQRLAGGRTRIVGVFTYEPAFPHDASDFYQPFLAGLEAEAETIGIDLLLFTSVPSADGRRRLPGGEIGRLRVADGCVLLGRRSDAHDLTKFIEHDFPFAFVGRREAAGGVVPYAAADYAAATAAVIRHLQELGHRRIALVSEFPGLESTEDRQRGFRTAMAAAGCDPLILEAPGASGEDVLDRLLAHEVSAVAVADVAGPVRRAALDRGLRVPGDLSIARLGDPESPEAEDVDWTGFLIPRVEMGARALRLVSRQLDAQFGGSSTDELLQVAVPCTFVAGSTCGPLQDNGNVPRQGATTNSGGEKTQ